MAYNDKHIAKDAARLPVASYYDPGLASHEPVLGADGAPMVRIGDGDDAAVGARTDAPSDGALSGAFSLVSLLKEMVQLLR